MTQSNGTHDTRSFSYTDLETGQTVEVTEHVFRPDDTQRTAQAFALLRPVVVEARQAWLAWQSARENVVRIRQDFTRKAVAVPDPARPAPALEEFASAYRQAEAAVYQARAAYVEADLAALSVATRVAPDLPPGMLGLLLRVDGDGDQSPDQSQGGQPA